MKKILFCLFISVFISGVSHAQNNYQYQTIKSKNQPLLNVLENHSVPDHRTCGTMDNLQNEIAADPSRAEYLRQLDKQTEEWIKNNQDYINSTKTLITIPVVVHVLYNTTAQNISDAQINSQITALNQDYRNLNADGTNVPSAFQSLRADVEVEFCLATVDPNGATTTGITRTQTSNTSFSMSSNNMKYTSQGGHDIWDRDNYLNIWVCNLAGGLLGYAQFPGGTAATDGVVILYTAFGTMGTAQAPYNKGRSATHEIGHWLNLIHIWADDGGGCSQDDQVTDTPVQADMNYGCPSFPQNTCGTDNMTMNYMDYTDDGCMYMFTLGQKARMVAALNGPRSPLLTSNVCGTTGTPPVADFTANVTTIPVGGTVNFTDLSTNTPTSWSWSFTGGTPATSTSQNPTGITYNTAGTYDVTLTATNSFGSDAETKTAYITVVNGNIPPIVDFTANVTTIPEGASINFTDLSANLPTSWIWSFTGGTPATSTQQNPANIVYSTAGTYDVKLVANNAAGSDSLTKTGYITVVVGGIAPTADFSGTPTNIPVGGSVNFTDLSVNFPTSWNWSFTGGTPATSSVQNPSGIVYSAAGSYPVTLTVSNATGTDSETKSGYINVTTGIVGLCDTLNYPLNGSPALYLSPAGHYATGTNEYRDKAKAQYFDVFSPYYRIMGGIYTFGAATGTGNATCSVWNNSGNNGAPGSSPLTTQSVSMSTIINDVTNSQSTYVMFDNPVIAYGPFYMGVSIPNTPGDSLAVLSNSTGQGGTPCKAWEQWSNDSWHNFSVAWSGNLNVKLAIFPIICMTTGVDENEMENVSIYPNPANTVLNIDFINIVPQNTTINLYNSLGNVVKSISDKDINDHKALIMLDDFSSGIYYISIHTNKTVFNKKITVIK